MSICNRLQQLRVKLGLSQQGFGERIGVSRFSISNYESGARNITDRVISDISREFNVDEEWLRTGEGEMFRPSDDSFVSKLVAEYNLGSLDQKILETYINLTDKQRSTINKYVQSLLNTVTDENNDNREPTPEDS